TARGHYPIADFRIHPGERVTLRSLGKEPVTRVDLDAETAAIEMMPYDVLQDRQKELQRRLVPGNDRHSGAARERTTASHRPYCRGPDFVLPGTCLGSVRRACSERRYAGSSVPRSLVRLRG